MADYELVVDHEMKKRAALAQEFCAAILDPGEQPMFVSDEATVFATSSEPEGALIERCARYYGVRLGPEDLKKPVWKLLDYLAGARVKA